MIGTILTCFFGQLLWWPVVVVPTALARVYFRCHWIGDTFAGALLGSIVGYCVWGYFVCECAAEGGLLTFT